MGVVDVDCHKVFNKGSQTLQCKSKQEYITEVQEPSLYP